MQRAGEAHEGQGCERAAAFAEAKTEIEQRLRTERFQHSRMAGLGGPMRMQHPVAGAGAQPHGDKRGDTRNEAIDQHRDVLLCTGTEGSGERRNLESAQSPQRFQRIVEMIPVHCEGAGDNRRFSPDPHRIQAAAGTGERFCRRTQKRAGERRGGCGVPDAHLAADEEIRRGGPRPADRRAPRLQRRFELPFRHCRTRCEIRRSGPGATRDYARGTPGIVKRADVDDLQGCSSLRREHADSGASSDEVADHLPCHTLRIGRHVVNGDTVVGDENRHLHIVDARLHDALQPGKHYGEVFEPAEGSVGLGQLKLSLSRARRGVGIDRRRGLPQPCQTHGGEPFSVHGNPATVNVTRSQTLAIIWCVDPASSQ